MPQAEAFRQLVEARAGSSCEYCRLLQAAAGVIFHIEHIRPRSRGGRTQMSNLALSCPGCNLAKAERLTGKDNNGQVQPLVNPRNHQTWLLGWHLHFVLDLNSGLILPRTAVGEATINTLRITGPSNR